MDSSNEVLNRFDLQNKTVLVFHLMDQISFYVVNKYGYTHQCTHTSQYGDIVLFIRVYFIIIIINDYNVDNVYEEQKRKVASRWIK